MQLTQTSDVVEDRLAAQVGRGQDLVDNSQSLADEAAFRARLADKARWIKFTEEVLVRSYSSSAPKDEFLASDELALSRLAWPIVALPSLIRGRLSTPCLGYLVLLSGGSG